jgi:hypothetical protein
VILGSVMVPAAHCPKIWVQIWAQFSLPGAPSALFTLLGITEDSSEVLCWKAESLTRGWVLDNSTLGQICGKSGALLVAGPLS